MAGRSRSGSGICSVAALALASTLFVAPSAALAATCTVTSTADYNPTTDPVITNTLRWCVEVIGNNDSTATDVAFNFTSGSGPWQIDVEYHLHITEADTTIDGSTQSGYTSVTPSSSGSYGVILDGSTNVSAPLILIDGAGAEIRALRIKDHEAAAPPGPPPHAIQVAANGATIAQNRIEDCSGGVAVFQDVENTLIGGSSSTEGNVIATTTNSDGIILAGVGTGNVIQHNVIDQPYASGIFALDSAVTTGLAALVTIDDNTVTYSGADAYIIFNSRVAMAGNYSDNNSGSGIVIVDLDGVTDRMTLRDNFVRTNQGDGIVSFGAEVSLWNNEVTGNAGIGIGLATSLGNDTSPDGTGPDDDTVAGGVIGSGTITADENTVQSNTGGGIALFDATIDNIATVELENDLGSNGDFEVAQLYPILMRILDAVGDPPAGAAVEVWATGGPDPAGDPLLDGVTDSDGYVGDLPGFDPDDASTWPMVPSVIVVDGQSGVERVDVLPHEVVVAPDIPEYSYARPQNFDGVGGAAFRGTCSSPGSPPCRYMQTEERDDLSCDILDEDPPLVECGLATISVPKNSGGSSQRSFFGCQPVNLPSGPRPLVIGLHGEFESIENFSENGACRMLEHALEYDFIVAYPIALPRRPVFDPFKPRWNDCRADVVGHPDVTDTNDDGDVDFIRALVPAAEAAESGTDDIDESRIYAWGHSNGGVLVHRLLTELEADEFDGNSATPALAGAAAITANEPLPFTDLGQAGEINNECSPTLASSVFGDLVLMPGDDDLTLMPYPGGWVFGSDQISPGTVEYRGGVRAADDQQVFSRDGTLDYWSDEFGISGTSFGPWQFYDAVPAGTPPLGDDDDGSTVTETIYGDWTDLSKPVLRFFHVQGGGHRIPGTGKKAQSFGKFCPDNDSGCVNMDINAIDEIWRSFQPREFIEDWMDPPYYSWDDTFVSIGPGVSGSGGTGSYEFSVSNQTTPASAGYIDELSSPASRLRIRLRLLQTYMYLASQTGDFKVLSAKDGNGGEVFSLTISVTSGTNDHLIVASGNPDNFEAEIDISDAYTFLEVEWEAASSTTGRLCVRRVDEEGEALPSGGSPSEEVCDVVPAQSPATSEDPVEEIWIGMIDATGTGALVFGAYESYRP